MPICNYYTILWYIIYVWIGHVYVTSLVARLGGSGVTWDDHILGTYVTSSRDLLCWRQLRREMHVRDVQLCSPGCSPSLHTPAGSVQNKNHTSKYGPRWIIIQSKTTTPAPALTLDPASVAVRKQRAIFSLYWFACERWVVSWFVSWLVSGGGGGGWAIIVVLLPTT